MNAEELFDFSGKEAEALNKAINKCISLGVYNPRFLLEDRVALKEEYYYQSDPAIPLKLLLPFHEQVIIVLRPFESKEYFEQFYDISVDDLQRLYIDNRVIPLIGSSPHLYEGLDYLDPIFELEPPTYYRFGQGALDFISGWKRNTYEQEALAELCGKFKDLPRTVKQHIREKRQRGYLDFLPKEIEYQLQDDSVARFTRLCCFGYRDFARGIARLESPIDVYFQLGILGSFLTEPFLLGASDICQRRYLEHLKNREFFIEGKRVKPFEYLNEPSRAFPLEIGRVLVQKEKKTMQILFPYDISMGDVMAIAGDSAFRKARRALDEYAEAVRKRASVEVVLSKKAAIDKIWAETRETIKSMDMEAKSVKWCLWGLALGVIGTLALSSGLSAFPGLITMLGAAVTLDKIIKPAPEIAYERVDSLAIALYDLEKVFRGVASKYRK